MIDGASDLSAIKGQLRKISEQRIQQALTKLEKLEFVSEVFLLNEGDMGESLDADLVESYLRQDPLDPKTIFATNIDELADACDFEPSISLQRGTAADATPIEVFYDNTIRNKTETPTESRTETANRLEQKINALENEAGFMSAARPGSTTSLGNAPLYREAKKMRSLNVVAVQSSPPQPSKNDETRPTEKIVQAAFGIAGTFLAPLLMFLGVCVLLLYSISATLRP
jgi:hypothetical protein